eukprot:EG_transcript_32270
MDQDQIFKPFWFRIQRHFQVRFSEKIQKSAFCVASGEFCACVCALSCRFKQSIKQKHRRESTQKNLRISRLMICSTSSSLLTGTMMITLTLNNKADKSSKDFD